MLAKKAKEFCDNHECTECIVLINNLDKRTYEEKIKQSKLCCENLLDIPEDEVYNMVEMSRKVTNK